MGLTDPHPLLALLSDCNTYNDAVSKSVMADEYLERFDSFNFFRQTGGHIITGPTMTNVMDIVVVIIK